MITVGFLSLDVSRLPTQFTGSKATFYILFALIYPLVIIDSKILDVYLYSWCVPICNCHAWLRAPRRSITRWSRKSSRALRMNSLWTRQGEQHRNVSVKVQKIYVPRNYSDFGRRKNVDWFCDSWNLLDAVFGTIHAWRAAILFLSPLVWNVYVYMFHEEWWVLAWTWWKFHNAHTTFLYTTTLAGTPQKDRTSSIQRRFGLGCYMVLPCFHIRSPLLSFGRSPGTHVDPWANSRPERWMQRSDLKGTLKLGRDEGGEEKFH
jgi:hypothetical protein